MIDEASDSYSSNKKLLGAPGRTTRSKDATSNKKLLGTFNLFGPLHLGHLLVLHLVPLAGSF